MKPLKHLQHFIYSFFDPNRLVYKGKKDKVQSRKETVPKGKKQVLTPAQIARALGLEPKKKDKKKNKKKKKPAVSSKPKTTPTDTEKPKTSKELKAEKLKAENKANIKKIVTQADALKVQMMNEAVEKDFADMSYITYEDLLEAAYPFSYFNINKKTFNKVYNKIIDLGLPHDLNTIGGWHDAFEELYLMGEIDDSEIASLLPDYTAPEEPVVETKPKPKPDKPGDSSKLPEYAKDVTVLEPPTLDVSTIVGKKDTWKGIEGVFNHYYGNWSNLKEGNKLDDSPNWATSFTLEDRMTKAKADSLIGKAYTAWLGAKSLQETAQTEKDRVDAGTSTSKEEKDTAASALVAADTVVENTFEDIKQKITDEKKDRIKELKDWADAHDLPEGYTFLDNTKKKIATNTAETALKAKIASKYRENPKLIRNILIDPNRKRIFTSFDKLYAGCNAGAFGELDGKLVKSKFLKPEEDNTANYKKMLEMFNAAIYLNNLDDFEDQDFLRA